MSGSLFCGGLGILGCVLYNLLGGGDDDDDDDDGVVAGVVGVVIVVAERFETFRTFGPSGRVLEIAGLFFARFRTEFRSMDAFVKSHFRHIYAILDIVSVEHSQEKGLVKGEGVSV